MPFVVDASIAASWLMPDEMDARADIAYDRLDDDEALAPSLWWFEVRNLLVTNERRGRLDAAAVRHALDLLRGLGIRFAPLPEEAAVFTLARRHRLTAYDAAYLDLALRERCPLATLDQALARAARAEAVGLLGD